VFRGLVWLGISCNGKTVCLQIQAVPYMSILLKFKLSFYKIISCCFGRRNEETNIFGVFLHLQTEKCQNSMTLTLYVNAITHLLLKLFEGKPFFHTSELLTILL
jgi:hypothetical protein